MREKETPQYFCRPKAKKVLWGDKMSAFFQWQAI